MTFLMGYNPNRASTLWERLMIKPVDIKNLFDLMQILCKVADIVILIASAHDDQTYIFIP